MSLLHTRFLAILIALMVSPCVSGQYKIFSHFGNSAFADARLHVGKPIPYSDSLSESLQNPFSAYEFRFGINSFDRMPQDLLFGYSSYGVGFAQFFMHSDTLGKPMAIFGFYSFPLLNYKTYRAGVELSTGISFHFNKFDFVSNPKNDLISTSLNVYFNLSGWSAVQLNERLDLLGSLDFTHFSNGTVKTPNKGLNAYGGSLTLRYHFQFEDNKADTFVRKTAKQQKPPDFEAYNEWQIWLGGGPKTTLPPKPKESLYPGLSLSTDVNHRYGWIGKFGVGADWMYDGSLIEDFQNTSQVSKSRFMFIGVHANHEFTVGSFALGTQLGTYLWKGMEAKGSYYIRASLRYDMLEHTFINLSLKTANGLKADYIEMGMGYRTARRI